MNGGICRCAINSPLTRPGMTAISVPDRIANSIAANGGNPHCAAK